MIVALSLVFVGHGAPADGSAWESPAGSFRVRRGGSRRYGAGHACSARRSSFNPDDRADDLGFRPVRPLR